MMRKNFLIRQTTPAFRLTKKGQKSSKGGGDNYFKNTDPYYIKTKSNYTRGVRKEVSRPAAGIKKGFQEKINNVRRRR